MISTDISETEKRDEFTHGKRTQLKGWVDTVRNCRSWKHIIQFAEDPKIYRNYCRYIDETGSEYAQDLAETIEFASERAREGLAAVNVEQAREGLAAVIAWSLLYSSLSSRAGNGPDGLPEALLILRGGIAAYGYVQQIPDPKSRFEALWQLAHEVYQRGDTPLAREIVEAATDTFRHIYDAEEQIEALHRKTLFESLHQQSLRQTELLNDHEVLGYLRQCINHLAGSSSSTINTKIDTYIYALVLRLAEHQRHDEAIEILHELRSPELPSFKTRKVFCAIVRNSNEVLREHLKNLVDALEYPDDRVTYLIIFANALIQINQLDTAQQILHSTKDLVISKQPNWNWDEKDQHKYLRDIAHSFIQLDDRDGALAAARCVNDEYVAEVQQKIEQDIQESIVSIGSSLTEVEAALSKACTSNGDEDEILNAVKSIEMLPALIPNIVKQHEQQRLENVIKSLQLCMPTFLDRYKYRSISLIKNLGAALLAAGEQEQARMFLRPVVSKITADLDELVPAHELAEVRSELENRDLLSMVKKGEVDIFPLFFTRDAEKRRWISQWYENIRTASSRVARLVPLLCKADEYTIAHDLALHALNSIRQAEQDFGCPSEKSKILLLVPALVAVEEMNQAQGVLASISSQLHITDGLEHVKAMCALAITLYNTDDLGSTSIAWEKAQSAYAQAVFLKPKDDAAARVSLAITSLLLGIDPDDAIDVVAQIVDVDSEDYFSIDEYRIRADGLGVLILRLAHRNKLQEEQSSRQSRILRLVSRSSRSQETKHIQKAVNALLDPIVLEKWHEKARKQDFTKGSPLHWLADPQVVDLFQYIDEDRRLNASLEEWTIDILDSYAGAEPLDVHRKYPEFAYIMTRAFLILGNNDWAIKPIIHVCDHRFNIDYVTVFAEADIRQSQNPAFARSLLDVFQHALGIVKDRYVLAQALPSLIAACLYVGDPDLVRETMMRLSNNDTYSIYSISANAIVHVIPAAMHTDPELVNQLFQDTLSLPHSGGALRGFTPIWRMPECRVHYREALDRAFNTQDEGYGALLFEILAPTLAANARVADLQRAVKVCKQYTDAQAKLKGLSGLAPALYQLGLDNKAEEAVAKAEEIAYRELEVVDIENDTIGSTRGLLQQVLNPLAVARAVMDQFDSALEHLRRIDIILKPVYYHQSYGRDVHRENFYEPLATLATILAKKSAYSEIQSILSEIHTDITARSQPIHQACDQVLESLCNIAIARQDTRLWHMICSLSGTAQRCTQKELRFITLAVLEMRDSKRLLDLLPFLKTDEELENVDDMKRSVVIHQHIAGLIETKEHREALRFIAAISDPDVRSQALEQFADSIDADERIVESEIADMLLDAFSTAREQNRATVWHYIGAFSGSMKRLGITSEVWERIMKVEAIVEEINESSGIQLRR